MHPSAASEAPYDSARRMPHEAHEATPPATVSRERSLRCAPSAQQQAHDAQQGYVQRGVCVRALPSRDGVARQRQ